MTPSGLVTGVHSGTTVITAQIGGVEDKRTIHVGPAVSIGPFLPRLFAVDTLHLRVDLVGARAEDAITFHSRSPAIATVSQAGVVTGVAGGTAQVIVTAGVSVDSTAVAVIPRPLPGHRGISAACGLQQLCLYTENNVVALTAPSERAGIWQYNWSPDGEQLAVVYDGAGGTRHGLWVSAWDGSGATEKARFGFNPSWSPDGRLTTYVLHETQVYVANAQWAEPFRVSTSSHQEISPKFAPDGREVGLIREGALQLYPPQILRTPRVVSVPGLIGDFDFSPDGRWIAVYSVQLGPANEVVSHGIWLIRPDGTGLRPLSPNCSVTGVCASLPIYIQPKWSPDGKYVVMRRSVDGGAVDQLEVRTAPEGVLIATGTGVGAAWSPDGSRLAFVAIPHLFTSLPNFTDIQLIGNALDGTIRWRPAP